MTENYGPLSTHTRQCASIRKEDKLWPLRILHEQSLHRLLSTVSFLPVPPALATQPKLSSVAHDWPRSDVTDETFAFKNFFLLAHTSYPWIPSKFYDLFGSHLSLSSSWSYSPDGASFEILFVRRDKMNATRDSTHASTYSRSTTYSVSQPHPASTRYSLFGLFLSIAAATELPALSATARFHYLAFCLPLTHSIDLLAQFLSMLLETWQSTACTSPPVFCQCTSAQTAALPMTSLLCTSGTSPLSLLNASTTLGSLLRVQLCLTGNLAACSIHLNGVSPSDVPHVFATSQSPSTTFRWLTNDQNSSLLGALQPHLYHFNVFPSLSCARLWRPYPLNAQPRR